MRQWILFGAAATAIGCVGWITYQNRNSEKIVSTTLSLLIAASVAAFLNLLLSEDTKKSTEFLAIFVVQKKTGAPVEVPGRLMRHYPSAISSIYYELPAPARAAMKLETPEGQLDCYLQVLQWEITSLLQTRYAQSWKVAVPAYKWPVGTNVFNSVTWAPDSTAGGHTLSYAQVRSELLAGNVIAAAGLHPTAMSSGSNLVLPLGVTATGRIDPGTPKRQAFIDFASKTLTLQIRLNQVQYTGAVGAYGFLVPQLDEEARKNLAMLTYAVTIEVTTSGVYQGSPDLPALKAWAAQVTDYLRDSLDANEEWNRTKQELELQRLLAPRPSGP